jgi:hypothetical protein
MMQSSHAVCFCQQQVMVTRSAARPVVSYSGMCRAPQPPVLGDMSAHSAAMKHQVQHWKLALHIQWFLGRSAKLWSVVGSTKQDADC